ncbi:APC family permease [Paraburkholderia humisilvae]|uniref:Potassium transporter KimA n=1 Tax=Paraburkholderia humisilvae TaxID=627669 RepID=A0A6J5DDH8_9BURK|nr:APC family permease [Paraburkholderia humisilvae]CAB3751182.1 Potassium transporter KimA [Paraburkholderia humisilvae]
MFAPSVVIAVQKVRGLITGKALDPLDPRTRRAIAIAPLLALVGLSADALSSACYGPEQAFLALGQHTPLAVFLAVATAATVFIISYGYSQLIELFPAGGGGYRVATELLGPRFGAVSGVALLVDYMLTVATSIASGVDALFSLLPPTAQPFKLVTQLALIVLMTGLNLRGMKQSIVALLPIFIGFVVLHAVLIVYGVAVHSSDLAAVAPAALNEVRDMSHTVGPLVVMALLMRAFSLGGGTYTGIEAVSNNVNMLVEPRVRNAKWIMFHMATSLAFTAGGIVLLYMLWQVKPVDGQTLNAVVFGNIIDHLGIGSSLARDALLALVLAFEAGLLLVGAQTGFLDGPTVLSNMAADSWVPRHFRHLSSRLVRRNGVIVIGITNLAIVLWTHGEVSTLVVLYSINVFLTFSLSLLGLCIHWWRQRDRGRWLRSFALALLGLSTTATMLAVMLVEKLTAGAWLTVLVTGLLIALCLLCRRHYRATSLQLARDDARFAAAAPEADDDTPLRPNPSRSTAIVLVDRHRSTSMHALLWIAHRFPRRFDNMIFLAIGELDTQSWDDAQLEQLQQQMSSSLAYYVAQSRSLGFAADCRIDYATHRLDGLTRLTEATIEAFPHSVCFASQLVFKRTRWLSAWLHDRTPAALQKRLRLQGKRMVLLPMMLG